MDLSAGGCKVRVPQVLPKGDRITLSFSLPDGSSISDISADVCASAEDPEGAWVGCEYHDPEEAAIYDIEFFVAATLARLRADSSDSNHVLIIEPDAGRIVDLQVGLKSAGYDVTVAPGPVDGFFWLRLSIPSVLLVSGDQQIVSGADVVKIVKTTCQFRDLPIIVYGGDASLGKRAVEAGATTHLPSAGEAQKLTRAVKELVEQAAPQSEEPVHKDEVNA